MKSRFDMTDYTNLNEHLAHVKRSLREYQIRGVAHTIKHRKVILNFRTGGGKTVTGLTGALYHRPRRVLILCKVNAALGWVKEQQKWFPSINASWTHIRGQGTSKPKRAKLWATPSTFTTATFAVAVTDQVELLQQKWDAVILDDYHKAGLRNRDTKLFKLLKALDTETLIFITWSVARKGPQDLWPTLHLCDSTHFSSYWKFVKRYCLMVRGPFGMEYVGPQNTLALNADIAHVLYRPDDAEVKKELPSLQRIPVPIELAPDEQQLYDQLANDLIAKFRDQLLVVPNPLTLTIKLREFIVSPKLVFPDFPTWGTSIETILDAIEDSSPEDQHCVIFTPFRQGVRLMCEALRERFPQTFITRIHGGMSMEEIGQAIDEFKKYKGIVVCTTLYSQSFELETSSVCYHLGWEWDQNDNEQAEGRLQRMISQHKNIRSYYVLPQNTVAEAMMQVLDNNTNNVRLTFHPRTADQLKNLVRPTNSC